MAVKYVRSDAAGGGDGTTTANSGANGAYTFAEFIALTPAAGDDFRIMATGTYSRSATATINFANATNAANIKISGANGTTGVIDGTRATIQASAGTLTLLSISSSHTRLDYLILDGNSQASVTGIDLTTNYMSIRRSKAMNCTVRGIRQQGTNGAWVDQCEVTGCSGTAAIGVDGGQARFCYSHDNTIHGFQMGAGTIAIGCIADTNTGGSTDGFNCSSVGYNAQDCVAYGNGRDGFNLDGNAGYGSLLYNCISHGNTGEDYGTDGSVKSGAYLVNCAGRAAGTGYNATNIPQVENYQTLTADPWTNSAAGDFSLNTTSGGGAACRAAGYPGVLPGGLTTGYVDIGAAQHQDAGGGLNVPVTWRLGP